MSEDRIDTLKGQLETTRQRLDRHADVLAAIEANPQGYDDEQVDAYLSALDEEFGGEAFLSSADEAIEPLESTAEAAQAEYLEGARVLVDDYEIEDVELVDFDPPEAAILVPSPKVNQIRGGVQRLEMPDGEAYAFEIEQTLVEDVAEDKSGYLKLVLSLRD